MDEILEQAEAVATIREIRKFAKLISKQEYDSKFGQGYQAAWERILVMLPKEKE